MKGKLITVVIISVLSIMPILGRAEVTPAQQQEIVKTINSVASTLTIKELVDTLMLKYPTLPAADLVSVTATVLPQNATEITTAAIKSVATVLPEDEAVVVAAEIATAAVEAVVASAPKVDAVEATAEITTAVIGAVTSFVSEEAVRMATAEVTIAAVSAVTGTAPGQAELEIADAATLAAMEAGVDPTAFLVAPAAGVEK